MYVYMLFFLLNNIIKCIYHFFVYIKQIIIQEKQLYINDTYKC